MVQIKTGQEINERFLFFLHIYLSSMSEHILFSKHRIAIELQLNTSVPFFAINFNLLDDVDRIRKRGHLRGSTNEYKLAFQHDFDLIMLGFLFFFYYSFYSDLVKSSQKISRTLLCVMCVCVFGEHCANFLLFCFA